jgi:hypothetical protein
MVAHTNSLVCRKKDECKVLVKNRNIPSPEGVSQGEGNFPPPLRELWQAENLSFF